MLGSKINITKTADCSLAGTRAEKQEIDCYCRWPRSMLGSNIPSRHRRPSTCLGARRGLTRARRRRGKVTTQSWPATGCMFAPPQSAAAGRPPAGTRAPTPSPPTSRSGETSVVRRTGSGRRTSTWSTPGRPLAADRAATIEMQGQLAAVASPADQTGGRRRLWKVFLSICRRRHRRASNTFSHLSGSATVVSLFSVMTTPGRPTSVRALRPRRRLGVLRGCGP